VNRAQRDSGTALITCSAAGIVAAQVRAHGLGPVFATPCGILAPLIDELAPDVLTVAREETAVGVAAGAAMAGRHPVVLMQNSGFGASVNALASLIQPYAIPILLIVSLRGVAPDSTTENQLMGTATAPILDLLSVPHRVLHPDRLADQVAWAAQTVIIGRRTAALLVPPSLFDWTPS
jgi:sulfopyruvate decarboxylase alpha subunit